MIPDFGGLIWMVICIILIIVFIASALVYIFWFEPPINRKLTKAKWSKCSPCFIQDNMGRVHLIINDTELPEGLFHNKRGWFITSTPTSKSNPEDNKDQKKKGRKSEKEKILEKCEKTVLETPILVGLGKTVFFGYDGTPLLANLKTLAHANLKVMRELLEKTDTKTRFALLHKWSVQKGYEKRGGEATKLIVIAIAVIGVVATVGIIAYLLLQSGGVHL